jgi:phosphatidylinositol phospholipase C delta
MLKVSAKKVSQRRVRIAPEVGQVFWESRNAGLLNIEHIRELRFGADAKGYREALGRGKDAEPRWTSIIYANAADKKIKVLHLIALTDDVFALWKSTLIALYDQRRALMGGLDQMRRRQSVWLRQHWKLADSSGDERLSFAEVVILCARLGIAARPEELRTNFDAADGQKRGYLDFADFQAFVRLLKRRPEVQKLAKEVAEGSDRISDVQFVAFMRKSQQSKLADDSLLGTYRKFCEAGDDAMSIEGFTSFLVSSENAAFGEQSLKPVQDMTRPLCEYFISSSHNVRGQVHVGANIDLEQTYLVGNQLNGESTTEGYIRALQQGCRTVERASRTAMLTLRS